MKYGTAASDLRVVGQSMYDDMVTDMTPRLKDVTVPVTLLYPQDDRLLTAAAAAKIAWLIDQAFALSLTGVALKDGSDLAALPACEAAKLSEN